jgi:hypothetical protein
MAKTINIFELLKKAFKKTQLIPDETPPPTQPHHKHYIPNKNFNDEIIWDNDLPLFDMHYKNKFLRERYELAYFDLPENIDFDDALNILVSYQ